MIRKLLLTLISNVVKTQIVANPLPFGRLAAFVWFNVMENRRTIIISVGWNGPESLEPFDRKFRGFYSPDAKHKTSTWDDNNTQRYALYDDCGTITWRYPDLLFRPFESEFVSLSLNSFRCHKIVKISVDDSTFAKLGRPDVLGWFWRRCQNGLYSEGNASVYYEVNNFRYNDDVGNRNSKLNEQ